MGSKVLEQISEALQTELPGLRGFSSGNLKKMRVLSNFWLPYFSIGSAQSNLLEKTEIVISSTPSNQLIIDLPENFETAGYDRTFFAPFHFPTEFQPAEYNGDLYFLWKKPGLSLKVF